MVVRSSDTETFELDAEAACMSGRLRTIVGLQGHEEEISLPLKKSVLRKVFEYCRHYKGRLASDIPLPLAFDTLEECGASKWDVGFISSMDNGLFFEAMVVSGFLEIPGLMHLLGAHASLMVRGKSADRLRKEFGLLSDLAPDEEARLVSDWADARNRQRPGGGTAIDDASGFGGVAANMQQLLAAAGRTGISWEEAESDEDRLTAKPKSFRQASWRMSVMEDWRQLGKAPADIRADRSIVCAALQASAGAALQLAADALRADRRIVLRAVELDGARLADAAADLRGDEDFVFQALALSGSALIGASSRLRSDRSFVLRALAATAAAFAPFSGSAVGASASSAGATGSGASGVLAGAAAELRGDRDFVLECVLVAPEALRGAMVRLREDRAFMLQVARRCGKALRFMEPRFRADAEVVDAAVGQDPQSCIFAHASRRAELCVELPWDDASAKAKVDAMKEMVSICQASRPARLAIVRPGRSEAQDQIGDFGGVTKLRKSVQFSALSSLLANFGQANYCASNCFLDKLPARQRPEIDAVTLMWGPVGSIGMRWKAFASQDSLLSSPDALLTINEASRVLRATMKAEPPEWYGVSLFDDATRGALLWARAGDGSGGGWRHSVGDGREDIGLRLRPSVPRAEAAALGGAAASTPKVGDDKDGEASRPGGAAAAGGSIDGGESREASMRSGRRAGGAFSRRCAHDGGIPLGGWPSLATGSGDDAEACRAPPTSAGAQPHGRGAGGNEGAELGVDFKEGCRVRLQGLGSKSGLEGVALKLTADGRWKVKLDGARGGIALLREAFLLVLEPASATMPKPLVPSAAVVSALVTGRGGAGAAGGGGSEGHHSARERMRAAPPGGLKVSFEVADVKDRTGTNTSDEEVCLSGPLLEQL